MSTQCKCGAWIADELAECPECCATLADPDKADPPEIQTGTVPSRLPVALPFRLEDLNELARLIHKMNREKGFWEPGTETGDLTPDEIIRRIFLAQGEGFEAGEELRSGHGVHEIYYREKDGKPEGFPVEIADMFIRLFDLAGALKLDLVDAFRQKLEFNASRPYKHGRQF